jgi:hypothetical protein
LGCVLILATSLALGVVVSKVLVAAWDSCGAGEPHFNKAVAILYGLLVVSITGIASAIALKVLARRRPRTAGVVAVGVAVAIAYLCFAVFLRGSVEGALFAHYGVGTCPGNVPPWWPRWLPI